MIDCLKNPAQFRVFHCHWTDWYSKIDKKENERHCWRVQEVISVVGSVSGQKQSVKLLQNMVDSTIRHPPPPAPDTVCIYCTFSLGRGGEVREKVEGQQYTSIVPSSMGATVHKPGRKYQSYVNVSPVYKIC
jgi:hypothetical protein